MFHLLSGFISILPPSQSREDTGIKTRSILSLPQPGCFISNSRNTQSSKGFNLHSTLCPQAAAERSTRWEDSREAPAFWEGTEWTGFLWDGREMDAQRNKRPWEGMELGGALATKPCGQLGLDKPHTAAGEKRRYFIFFLIVWTGVPNLQGKSSSLSD